VRHRGLAPRHRQKIVDVCKILFLYLLQMLVTGRWILDKSESKIKDHISRIKHPVSVLSKVANFTAPIGPPLPSAVSDKA